MFCCKSLLFLMVNQKIAETKKRTTNSLCMPLVKYGSSVLSSWSNKSSWTTVPFSFSPTSLIFLPCWSDFFCCTVDLFIMKNCLQRKFVSVFSFQDKLYRKITGLRLMFCFKIFHLMKICFEKIYWKPCSLFSCNRICFILKLSLFWWRTSIWICFPSVKCGPTRPASSLKMESSEKISQPSRNFFVFRFSILDIEC